MEHPLLTSLLAVAFATALPAQDLAPYAPGLGLTAPLHRTADGELWAVGDHYKASFHDGFRFVPYLGEAFAANQEFAWHTASIRCGGIELLPPDATPTVRPAAAQCDLVWTADVVERYLLGADGVEQTFVFRQLPPVRGELVITGRVTSPLQGEGGADQHGEVLWFAANGQPVVRYGAAFAVDADGERLPIRSRWHGDGTLQLAVPAEWLLHAAFPVVVDPLVGTVTMATGNTVQNTDLCAFDAQGLTYVAYSRLASASDGDVFLRRVTGGGLGAGAVVFTDVATAVHARRPAVAPSLGVGRVALAYQRRDGSADTGLAVHFRALADAAVRTDRLLLAPPAGAHWSSPDLGGQGPGSVDGRLCLVFEEDTGGLDTTATEVKAQLVDALLGSAVGSAFRIPSLSTSQVLADRARPRINQANAGGSDGWVVVYQDLNRTSISDDWDLLVARITAAGAVASRWTGNFDDTLHKLNPYVAGRGGDYRVLFAALPVSGNELTPTALGSALWSARLTWPVGGAAQLRHAAPARERAGGHRLFAQGLAVDAVEAEFAVASYVDYSSGELRVATLGGSGEVVADESVRTGPDHYGGSITAQASPRRFPLSSTDNSGSGPLLLDAFQHAALPPVTSSGTACGGALAARGEHRLGNGRFALELTFARPDSLAVFVIGAQPALQPLDPLGMPGCTAYLQLGTALGSVGVTTDANGRAELALPLTARPALTAVDLFVQAAFLAPGVNAAGALTTGGLVLPLR